MPFLAFTQNRSSEVLSTSGPNLVVLEQFAPNRQTFFFCKSENLYLGK